jgi:hypothetical protein
MHSKMIRRRRPAVWVASRSSGPMPLTNNLPNAACCLSTKFVVNRCETVSLPLPATPKIINTSIEGATDWSTMGELTVD